jgi:hypothetical protein
VTSWLFIAMVLGLPVAGLVLGYLHRRLESQERIAAIEKGLPMEPQARDVAARTRRTGIVLVAAGLGIIAGERLLTALEGDMGTHIYLALAIIPIATGIGFLVDYRLQLRDLVREEKGNRQ